MDDWLRYQNPNVREVVERHIEFSKQFRKFQDLFEFMQNELKDKKFTERRQGGRAPYSAKSKMYHNFLCFIKKKLYRIDTVQTRTLLASRELKGLREIPCLFYHDSTFEFEPFDHSEFQLTDGVEVKLVDCDRFHKLFSKFRELVVSFKNKKLQNVIDEFDRRAWFHTE